MSNSLMKEYLGLQFFGEYLIDHWIITREHLLEALAYQEERNLRFGDIAVKKGFLDAAQVEAINDRQRTKDVDFGAAALEMGLLTREQIAAVSTFQKNNNLCLGDTLLRLGHISEEVLARELEVFGALQARYAPKQITVPPEVACKETVRAVVDATRKMFLRVVDSPLKIGRGILLEPSDGGKPPQFFVSVTVTLEGANTTRFCLSVAQPVAERIAAAILKAENAQQSAELMLDSVKELTNIICGTAAATLARQGVAVDITPPVSVAFLPSPAEARALVFPTRARLGGVDLRFLL